MTNCDVFVPGLSFVGVFCTSRLHSLIQDLERPLLKICAKIPSSVIGKIWLKLGSMNLTMYLVNSYDECKNSKC